MNTYCDQVWPLTGYVPMYCPGFALNDVIDLTLQGTGARFPHTHSPGPGLRTSRYNDGRDARIAPCRTVPNSNDNKNTIVCDGGKLSDASDESPETSSPTSLSAIHGGRLPSPPLVSSATPTVLPTSSPAIPDPQSDASTMSPISSTKSTLPISRSTDKLTGSSSCVCCMSQPQVRTSSNTPSIDAPGLCDKKSCDKKSTASGSISSTLSSLSRARGNRYTHSPPPLWPPSPPQLLSSSPSFGSSSSPNASPTHARRSPSPPPLWPPSPPPLSPTPKARRDATFTMETSDTLSDNSGPTSSAYSSLQSSPGLSSSRDSGVSSPSSAYSGETPVIIGDASVGIDCNSDIEELSVDISLDGIYKKRKKKPWQNRYSQSQVQTLKQKFNEYPYPDYMTMEAISKNIYLTVNQVRQWFANRRRQKLKKALVTNSMDQTQRIAS